MVSIVTQAICCLIVPSMHNTMFCYILHLVIVRAGAKMNVSSDLFSFTYHPSILCVADVGNLCGIQEGFFEVGIPQMT